MAARRLVAVLVALLVLSTVAAILAPDPDPDPGGGQSPESAPDGPPAAEPEADPRRAGGGLVRASIRVGGGLRRLELQADDQLALVVRSRRQGQVEIPALGRLATAGPGSPARLDLLPERSGVLEVTFTPDSPPGADPLHLATIEVVNRSSMGEREAQPDDRE